MDRHMASYPDADHIVDRRILRRKLSFWRIVTFLIVAGVLVAAGLHFGAGDTKSSHHIARLSIEGVITGDKETLKLVRDIGHSRTAEALIVSIESPGGTTTGAERLFKELRAISEKKPVVAVVGTMAASGGYIAALGTDRIFAEGNSLVGSIGVLFQYPNFGKLLDTVGVSVESVKSSPLKASPSGYEPTSPEARAAIAALVGDSFAWFKDLVQTRRDLNEDELAKVSDGRVFTGRQSIELKLVDALGGEREAIGWLERERKIGKGLPVRDWKKDRSLERLGLLGASAAVLDGMGLNDLAAPLRRLASFGDARLLDGLVSIWQVAPVD
jgi:protease-4